MPDSLTTLTEPHLVEEVPLVELNLVEGAFGVVGIQEELRRVEGEMKGSRWRQVVAVAHVEEVVHETQACAWANLET